MQDESALKQAYQEALDAFLERIKADSNIIAAYVYGSLVRGDLWRKSDIDIFLVTRNTRTPFQAFSLVENGINFHAEVYSRNHFKRAQERLLRGSALHTIFSSGELVYTTDETLHEYYTDTGYVGERDLELLTLLHGASAVCGLYMTEKALRVKHDVAYSFVWAMRAIEDMARVEVSLNGKVIKREVIHQAVECNPAVFTPLFTGLLQKKDAETMEATLLMIDTYLTERATIIFKPILAVLAAAGEVRGASELYRHFEKRLHLVLGDNNLTEACEWLVEKGILQKVCAPVRLTTKSRVQMDEAAYQCH
ncbi:MAG: nucleotidyltransferase domain-containing protein [Chloroflexi bacterium]|nr:nucleotidyltransferase domain-containing protein [Chloroflexota bacterium]